MKSFLFSVSSDQLLILFSLFGDLLSRSLILVDKKAITLYTHKDKRIYSVRSDKDRYLVQPDVNFCPCPSFRYQVVQSDAEHTCKHVLAARLATILGRQFKSNISEEYFASLTSDYLAERDQKPAPGRVTNG